MPALDGIRGFAVLWIVLGHCWNELGGRVPLDDGALRHIFVSSYIGVDLLFIVSGFVLFLPAVVDGSLGDRRRYALRRAARIVPAFYAAVLGSAIVSSIVNAPTAGPSTWLSHALFLHTESHDISKLGFGVNGAMWTMSVEVAFYVALPLVATWYRHRPFAGLLLAVLGAEVWHVLTSKLPELLSAAGITWAGTSNAQLRMALAFPGYLTQFATGMTAAWLYVRLRDRRDALAGHAALAQCAAAIGLLAVAYLRGWEGAANVAGRYDHWTKTIDRTFLFGVLALATALASSRAQRFASNRMSRALGRMCYGTYLSHMPLIALFIPVLGLQMRTTSNTDFLLLTAIVIPLSLVAGALSHRYLETPFRIWARRTSTRRRTEDTQEVLRPRVLAPSRA